MKRCFVLGIVLLLVGGIASAFEELTSIVLLATDAAEGKAVLQVADGPLQVVAPGDPIERSDAIVEKVLEDRVVVRESASGTSTSRRLAWIYLRGPTAKASRIRYFEWRAEVADGPAPRPPAKSQPGDVPEGSRVPLRKKAPVGDDAPDRALAAGDAAAEAGRDG